MTYSQHYNFKKEKTYNPFAGSVGLLVSVIILCVVIIFLRAPVITLFSQVIRSTSSITTKADLIRENNKLQLQVNQLQSDTAQLALLKTDNDDLRTQMNYIKNPDQYITAQIITRPHQDFFDAIMIDQGSQSGITVGQLVGVGDSIVIGSVSAVFDSTARVDLYVGQSFTSDVRLKKSGINLPAQGSGNGNISLRVPRDIVVTDGDIITLPNYPDRALGIIKSITFDPRDPYQTVIARSPININELKFVQVIK